MKVKDLLEEIQKAEKRYGKDFLDWDIYVEQISENDKNGGTYKMIKDNEDWDYAYCYGFNTFMPDEKVFTINVNF